MSGDYTVADTLYFLFTTRRFTTGAPFTLAGSPVISAYENEGLTQITAGVSLGVDHDGVTGLNLCTVVASGANGFESGKDYHLVITTGTVDSVSVVGEVVGRFTLSRSAAAVDLANGTDGLGAIKTDTAAILVDTGTTLDAKIDVIDGIVDLILADTNELQTDWVNGGRLDLILDARASQTSVDDLPTNAELATALGTADDATLAAIAALPTATQNADALLNRDMSAVTVTNARSPINALRWLRNKWSNAGGTLTVYKEDDTTTAWTATTTTAASDPVDSVDPA